MIHISLALDAAVELGDDRTDTFPGMEIKREPVQAFDGGFEELIMQADARFPRQPVGGGVAGFAEQTQAQQADDAQLQGVCAASLLQRIENELQYKRFRGVDGRQQECDGHDDADGGPVRKSKA